MRKKEREKYELQTRDNWDSESESNRDNWDSDSQVTGNTWDSNCQARNTWDSVQGTGHPSPARSNLNGDAPKDYGSITSLINNEVRKLSKLSNSQKIRLYVIP